MWTSVRPWPADATGRSRFLHNSFVCAILNDIFGVQVRGGCACAGPYALHLLGRAVQVDPIKPMLKAPGTRCLKLKYDKPLSSFASKGGAG